MMSPSTQVLMLGFALSLLSFIPSPLCAGDAATRPGLASAVSAPAVTPLRAYRDGLSAPSGIATDSAGRVYITDYSLGQVIVRDESGRLISVKDGLDHPLGIAVDDIGRIYVGEEGTGSVSIFLPNWSLLGKFGQGAGEFQMPNHITIAPPNYSHSEMVLVSDSRADLIKVYDRNGYLIRQFGGSGNTVGQFNFPSGIFVNSDDEIFVADQDNNRIQVFTSAGGFLRSFGRSTLMGLGTFSRTQGLTGDSKGRIFVADAFQGTVKVIDAQGNVVSTVAGFGDGPGELRTPTSLAIDRNNRLFVVSTGNTRIEILGLDTFSDPFTSTAIISLLPSSFNRDSNRSTDESNNNTDANRVVGLLKVVGELPEMIVLESVTANGVVAQLFKGSGIDDFDGDGTPEARIYFNRKNLVATLPDGIGSVVVKGTLANGKNFEGLAAVYVTPSLDEGRGGEHRPFGSLGGNVSSQTAEGGSR